MGLASMLAAAGVWPALPLTGYLLFVRPHRTTGGECFPTVTTFALMTAAGFAVWSAVLLCTAVAGVYRGDYLGLLGWLVSCGALVVWFRTTPAPLPSASRASAAAAAAVVVDSTNRPRRDRRRGATHVRTDVNVDPRTQTAAWNWLLIAGLVVAAALYLSFPSESIYGARDEGVYSNSAVYLAHHGGLAVPYPWPADSGDIFADVWIGFPGFYKTQPTMTVQFGHLLPVWLAQAFSTGDAAGLFRLNAVFAVLSAAVFYGVCRTVMPTPYAVAATLFFALNPSQLWMARITLSEICTQFLMWSGLLLLLRALTDGDRFLARWGGAFLGLSAFVRFDSFLLLPLLFLAHAAWNVAAHEDAERAAVWGALYQTALPIFALALGYFAVFSTPYLMERSYWQKLVGTAVGSALVLLAARPAAAKLLRPMVTSTIFVATMSAAVVALAAYAYWIRPIPTGAPLKQFQWPGYYWDYSKGNHSIESLVNLAAYLSPVVIWLGIGGWCAAFWEIARLQRRAQLLVVLIVAAGMSAVYLYDHSNTPDHFWVIRRYVAVVIPGFIVFAALGAHRVLTRLPHPWSVVAGVAGLIALAVFTVRADALILTFAEDKGYFDQIAELAKALPPDEVILARGFTEWVTPLYFTFDRRVLPLNLDPGRPGRHALEQWVARQAQQGKPVHLLAEGAIDLPQFHLRPITHVVVTRVFTEPTTEPLPKKVISKERALTLYEISP